MKRDIIARIKSNVFNALIKSALAEEEPTSSSDDGGNEPTPTTNFEDLIAKAREDEKKKQYKTIERLKSQNVTLTEQHNNDLLLLADKDKKIQSLSEKLTSANSGDDEQIKTLKAEVKSKETKIAELEGKINSFNEVDVDVLTEQIKSQFEQEYAVKEHKLQVLTDNKDKLLVPELVMGSTIEDIDNSLQVALKRSEEIRNSLGVQTSQNVTGQMPKPSNPSVAPTQQQGSYDLDSLANMDVTSPEYAELRKKMGLR